MRSARERRFASFELNFENSLARQLGPFFDKLPAAELNAANLGGIAQKARGAYYLYLDEVLVYIGKSDAQTGLNARLLRHFRTLQNRVGITGSSVKFKAVKIASFSAIDTETLLLDLHKRSEIARGRPDKNPAWNYSGFGSNDPGRERDTQKVSPFDAKHPIDLETAITLAAPPALDVNGSLFLSQYLEWLSLQMPFTFRYQKRQKDVSSIRVQFATMTASATLSLLLSRIHETLPPDWTLTVLRGKVLLYKNDSKEYKSPVWRLRSGHPLSTPNYKLEPSSVAEEEPNDGDVAST